MRGWLWVRLPPGALKLPQSAANANRHENLFHISQHPGDGEHPGAGSFKGVAILFERPRLLQLGIVCRAPSIFSHSVFRRIRHSANQPVVEYPNRCACRVVYFRRVSRRFCSQRHLRLAHAQTVQTVFAGRKGSGRQRSDLIAGANPIICIFTCDFPLPT